MFLVDYAFFSPEDIRWNNHTFTWYDNIQPILRNAEVKLLKEKDNWISKLRDKRAKLTMKLNECLARVKEFKQRDKISDAEAIVTELQQMSADIEEYIKEVSQPAKLDHLSFRSFLSV